MNAVASKRCSKCGQDKPVSEFYAAPKGGLRAACKSCIDEQGRRWRAANPEKARESSRRYEAANRRERREKCRRQHAAIREKVFAHYGASCACCGATENLSVDHVDGSGAAHREELYGSSRKGSGFYWWLVEHSFPDGYQALCLACNTSKGKGERCRMTHGLVVS